MLGYFQGMSPGNVTLFARTLAILSLFGIWTTSFKLFLGSRPKLININKKYAIFFDLE